jgi:hypothetical protein
MWEIPGSGITGRWHILDRQCQGRILPDLREIRKLMVLSSDALAGHGCSAALAGLITLGWKGPSSTTGILDGYVHFFTPARFRANGLTVTLTVPGSPLPTSNGSGVYTFLHVKSGDYSVLAFCSIADTRPSGFVTKGGEVNVVSEDRVTDSLMAHHVAIRCPRTTGFDFKLSGE